MSSDDPTTSPLPRTTRKPWEYIGISRSGFYRLMSADKAPQPLLLPGTSRVWRISDLDRWLAKLPTGRKPRKVTATPA
jgi:predicted DNA-binding transcriptional regulator AlpA